MWYGDCATIGIMYWTKPNVYYKWNRPLRENGIFWKMFGRLDLTQKGSSVAHSPCDIYITYSTVHSLYICLTSSSATYLPGASLLSPIYGL